MIQQKSNDLNQSLEQAPKKIWRKPTLAEIDLGDTATGTTGGNNDGGMPPNDSES